MRTFTTRLMLVLCTLALGWTTAMAQGVTTSSINGQVTDTNGEPLIGANIFAVHTPTGATYGNSTNIDGLYRIANMKVGGPYTITVTYTGYQDFVQENVYLQLGQAFNFSVELSETAITIEGVEVVAYRNDIFDGNRTGAETTITDRDINSLPTVARAIGDFTRLTPQGTVTEGGDGLALSFNGMNNRYNAIYFDGAVNNDVFGLAGSGTNGGQTGVSPIPIDAIEEFSVALAPFDVRLGGFAGGAINAVTRSGTNNFEGSAYTFFRNEGMAGKTPPIEGVDQERTRLADFTAQTTGFRLGGPILKNKAFFFVNAEIQRDETPLPFDIASYLGDADEAALGALSTKLNEQFGYDPGPYNRSAAFLNSEKVVARLDFNLNQNHKLMLRGNYVNARNLEAVQSTATRIRFLNESEYFESQTLSVAGELSSVFGNNMANKLIVGYTRVRDDRDPYDPTGGTNYFPYVEIQDGNGAITFGAEQFSTANQLDQDIITLTNNFEIYKGRHTITIGTHNEFYSMYNLFIRQNYGVYEYDSLSQFINDQDASLYFRSYSLVDDVTGDGSAAAAEFGGAQFGVYVQDDWQVTNQFKLTGGIRLDVPIYFGGTPENEAFNTETVPLLEEAGYDLRGARTGTFVEPQFMISPRVGFNWDVTGDRTTQLRGGVGIFTSRVPLVWPGGAFNNNGSTVGGDFIPNPGFGVSDNPDWQNQPQLVKPEDGALGGQIDLFAADFKLPQVLKANLALDQKLPGGFIVTLDGQFNKILNNVAYQNLNLKPAIGNLTGTPDDRPIFDRGDEVDDTYTGIYLAYNTNEGYTYNGTVTLTKPFQNGFTMMAAYSYGDAFAVFDGTSSQNSSQWRGLHSVGGRNFDQPVTRSDFAQGHRIISYVSYELPLGGTDTRRNGMTISLFYEGQQGQPFSYTYNDRGQLTNEDSRERALIYIPENQSDVILVENDGLSPDEQWALLDDYIENDPYLSQNRGDYAARNSNRMPFSHVVDLRLLRDFTITSGKKDHMFQLSVDIFNFTNLLNKNWGKRYFTPFNYELMNFEGFQADGTTPTFSIDRDFDQVVERSVDDRGIVSSRWQMQVGLRYTFN
jgi:outer membrane receptor for ferrienterochelin and colicin